VKSGKINTFSVIELNVALIAASMPALRIVFVDAVRRRIPSEEAPNTAPLFIDPPSRRRGTIDIDQILESDPEKNDFVSFAGVRPSDGTSLKSQECIVERSCDVDKISAESVA
jgi:cobalamin biosynthesis protein CbiG